VKPELARTTVPTIGVLRPGSTFPGMIDRFGDYDAWFARALEPAGVRITVHDVVVSPPPDHDSAGGWMITGSRSSLTAPEPWAEPLMGWIREATAREVPLLGVCYGHQAVCAALGGRVVRHPEGWEIGTVSVELTAAGRDDPLFAGFPERFLVQTTHEDHVTELPAGAVLLAGNVHSPVQAAAIGPRTRTVQFHPEVTTPIAADFVARRRDQLARDTVVVDALLASRVLTNFVDAFVRTGIASSARP
jgi:GMP synthase (glutamine-hydrolysing)